MHGQRPKLARYRAKRLFDYTSTNRRSRGARLAGLLFAGLILTACTRASVPVQSIPTPYLPTPTIVIPTATPTETPPPPTTGVEYAVVGVEETGQLPVRSNAGLSGVASGYLTPQQRGIHLTGNATLLGSSQWVEIVRADGRTGWVQASMLTEYVPPDQFCGDGRANAVVSAVSTAITERDGDALAALVNETRGLIIRVDWWNPEVQFSKEKTADLFADPTPVDWGTHFASNTPINGAFADIILPQLDDVLVGDPALTCDTLKFGSADQEIKRPTVYTNLNFYEFYRPAPEGGNEFNWRAWTILIEYIDGDPYLVGLVQYRPQV